MKKLALALAAVLALGASSLAVFGNATPTSAASCCTTACECAPGCCEDCGGCECAPEGCS